LNPAGQDLEISSGFIFKGGDELFTYIQKGNLIRILKDYKKSQSDLPSCFRDDEMVDELLAVLNKKEPFAEGPKENITRTL
jgi:hypothetical protein